MSAERRVSDDHRRGRGRVGWCPGDCPTVAVGSVPVLASSRGFVHGPGKAGVIMLVVDADRDMLAGPPPPARGGGEVLGMLKGSG